MDTAFYDDPRQLRRVDHLAPAKGDPEDRPDEKGWYRRVIRPKGGDGFLLCRQKPARFAGWFVSEVVHVPTLDADVEHAHSIPEGMFLRGAAGPTVSLSLRNLAALWAALDALGVPVKPTLVLADIGRAVDAWLGGPQPPTQESVERKRYTREPSRACGPRGHCGPEAWGHLRDDGSWYGAGRPASKPGAAMFRPKPSEMSEERIQRLQRVRAYNEECARKEVAATLAADLERGESKAVALRAVLADFLPPCAATGRDG